MIAINFIFILAFIWIVFASVEDLKKKEVSNWLNFSFIIFVLGARFFYSLFYEANFNFFLQGVFGVIIFFALANAFYYTKVFAGGDAKLMTALGAVLPISNNFLLNLNLLLSFLFIFLFVGAFYGLFVSIFFAMRDFNKFKKEFSKNFKKNKNLSFVLFIIGLLFILFRAYSPLLVFFGVYSLIVPVLYIFSVSVENSNMIKRIKPENLREGDWIYQDVKVGKKIIKASWRGLTNEQINIIKKNFKSVKVKVGIAFVPVFLISFLLFALFSFLGIFDNLFKFLF